MEPNIKSLNIEEKEGEENPQGAADLVSEQPEGSQKPVAGETGEDAKIRKRYSGAARRRYNKQLRREKEGSNQPSTTSGKGSEGPGEGGRVGAVKRPRPEQNTPSSTTKEPGKRQKTREQGTYAQVAIGHNKLAVVMGGYPDRRPESGEVELIRKTIRGRILDLPQGTKAPAFTGFWERDGALIITCADEATECWLKEQASSIEVKGEPLRVLPLGELPKRHRVVVHVEESDISPEEALKLLGRQNSDLKTEDWMVTRGSGSRDASSAHFACLIGDGPLEALKRCGFRPYCGLGRASIRIVGKGKEGESKPPPPPATTTRDSDVEAN